MRPRAAEDPMQNTWSIGRTWKPREGWSRPVLMVERQPTSTRPRGCVAQDPAGPREGAQGARPHTRTISQQQPRPLSGPRTATRRRETPFPGRYPKICGGHGPGETPGPIPNPEAKTWHGDGTAPDRVWESSTPPHHTTRTPGRGQQPPGALLVYVFAFFL